MAKCGSKGSKGGRKGGKGGCKGKQLGGKIQNGIEYWF